MPYRRYSTRKKRFARRRRYTGRYAKKQMLKPIMNGRLRQPIHYFTRHVDFGTISGDGTGTETLGSFYFRFSEVPGYAEFSAMYDYYQIKAVKVTFIPVSNVSLETSAYPTPQTQYDYRLITVLDYNDSAVPSSLDVLRQYSNCKVTSNNRIHKRYLHPRPLVTIDEDSGQGGVYSYGEAPKNQWIAIANNQVRYFGIKYGFEQTNNSTLQRYRVEAKYYLCFKGKN